MNNNQDRFLSRLWRRLSGRVEPPAVETSEAVESLPPTAIKNPPASNSSNKTELNPAETIKPKTDASESKERVIRVFVSSTFLDMIEDRNALMAHAWPELRKLCRERAVEFVEVDLRWGISEAMSQRQETVRHCLAEIKRCRPYFIGLLGERYGWMPESKAYSKALLDEEPWLRTELAQHSVTELEIMHGVLNDPDMAGRAFFYFRDPAYALTQGSDYLSEDQSNVQRLQTLKENIRTLCKSRNIPLREGEQYSDPQALPKLILADLTPAINQDFPDDQMPDVWAREARDHQAFANSRRSRYYVGRDTYFQQLNRFAETGDEGKGLTVLGESGGGKTALLANWVHHWKTANPDDFIFQHYIGSSPMSAGHLALMRRLMVSIVRWCAGDGMSTGFGSEEERIPAKAEEIIKVFPDYLARLTYRAKQQRVRAVIVLDALNQLEISENAHLLAWLPYRMPGEVRLIVSTLAGDTLDALQVRSCATLSVEPLTATERVQVITAYLKHFSQELSDEHAERIATANASSNPLYIKTLLDDLRVTGSYETLGTQIDDYLKATNLPALFGKILERYERDYQRDRPDLVSAALSLLWAARRGLTEPELLELLKPEDQERLPAALWTPLRYALAESLVDRDGVLAFAHEHLRQAVEQKYLPYQDEPRLRLADYFEAQPVSARSCDELPWLLRQTECFERLRECLLDIERFLLIHQRDQNELMQYWVDMGSERTMGQSYLDSFTHWERENSLHRIGYVAGTLGGFLLHAGLYPEVEPLLQKSLRIYEQVLGAEHPDTLSSVHNLAVLLLNQGNYTAAEPLCRRVLDGNERVLGAEHPHTLNSMNALAGLLKAQGNYTAAEPLYQRVQDGCERVLGAEHPDTLSNANDLALLLQEQGNYATAELLYRRALDGKEGVLGEEHPSTLRTVRNLALLLYAQSNYVAAEPLCRRALDGFERILGAEHPETLISVGILAGLLNAQGNYAAAEPLFRRALDSNERVLGSEHPSTLNSVNALAVLLYTQGNYAAAEPLFRRALDGNERVLGAEHPGTLINVNNLALLLQAQGNYTAAEPLCRRTLDGFEQVLGAEHPETLGSVNALALLLQAQGNYAAAEPLYRRALAGRERLLGAEHSETLRSVNNLATLLQAQGDYVAAEPLYRRALDGFERVLGAENPHTTVILENFISLLEKTGKADEASQLREIYFHKAVLARTHFR